MGRINKILLTSLLIAILLIIGGLCLHSLIISIAGFVVYVIAIIFDIKQCDLYRKNNPNCSPWDFL